MKPIYTFDIETDPFVYGRDPKPFTCGLYTGDQWFVEWGENCVAKMWRKLMDLPSGIVYAHNGGRFDFYFCMDWIARNEPVKVIAGRVVSAKVINPYRKNQFHELRDSFALMPFALKQYKKDEVDYRCFEKEFRESHKDEIIKYLKADCVYLHELCVSFNDMFGDFLTIGSASMAQFKTVHTFENLTETEDYCIRKPYYYGGRVQCMEKGIITPSKGNELIAYDLNQCYPYAMHDFKHPIGHPTNQASNTITDNTFFVSVDGINRGAFPTRTDNGLKFDVESGTFHISIYEYNAAIETGLFEMKYIRQCVDFAESSTFAEFVDKFHALRKDAQERGDKTGALFYKYVGNSCYGKLAQDPENYWDYKLTDRTVLAAPWEPCALYENVGYILWRKRSTARSRYNVAAGASITGAARSLLIRAIAHADRPIYCDTDSLVCEGLVNVPISPTRLGAWKIEARGTHMAIGGRKLYAMFGDVCPSCGNDRQNPIDICADEKDPKANTLFHTTGCIKTASKGVHLSPSEILAVASGEKVTWKKDAPTFDFKTHSARYLSRIVQMT